MTEHDHDDLRLLAAFRADLDEETPGRMASVRAAFVRQQSLKGKNMNARKTIFTPRRIAIVALPAVAAIALGAVALGSIGGGAAPKPPVATETQERHALSADADAATVLKYLAVSASHGTDAPGIDEGQFILERAEGVHHSVKKPELGELDLQETTWWDPFAGMQQAKFVGVENGVTDEWTRPMDVMTQPSIGNPTPAYLAALPSDPDAVVAQFREEFRLQVNWDWKGAGKGRPDSEGYQMKPGTKEYEEARAWGDAALFNEAVRTIMLSEIVMTAEQRSVLWEALSRLEGVTRTDGTVLDGKGREGIALGTTNPENGHRGEVIVDPETSKVLGHRSLDADGKVVSLRSIDLTVVDSLDER